LSIAAALLIPLNPPSPSETRSTTSGGDDAFASLLEAEVGGAETPAAAATLQTYSTVAPAVQLQTLASSGTEIGALMGLIAPATASGETDATAAITQAAASPAAPTQVDGTVADLIVSDGSATTPAAVTPQQSAAVGGVVAATIAPGDDATDTDIETDISDAGVEGAGEAATTSAAVVPAAPAGALAMLPAAPAQVLQVVTDASTAGTQPAVASPEVDPASKAAPADTAGAAPANPGGRASTTQTQNQPAVAAAAAQSNTAAPTDAAAAKPDFAAMLASPSTQGADAPAQTPSPTTEAARMTQTPAALQAAPAATVQVYNRIIERADGRAQRFEIRLDPAELGRVDVRIEIGADRKVHAVLAAHDSAALSDLMRGQRALERALADAGIDLADNGVRFELARDNGSGSASQQRDSHERAAQADVWRRFDAMTMPVTEDTAAAVRPSWRPQRLDLVA
jgi:chemotaxis protein MotD